MQTLLREFRNAARQLAKTPGFSLSVILTLALGIGATTAIFSLVEGILLRPLSFPDPCSQLVVLGDHVGKGTGLGVTAREIGTYAQATNAFASVGGYVNAGYELSGGAIPENISAARFTAGIFPTLGVQPLLGRVFTQQEENARQPLVVISYPLWLNRYHRDPHVLGSAIYLDRTAYTIIGVMPRSFEFPLRAGHLDQAQLWVPLSLSPDELSEANAGDWRYEMVARVKPGVALSQAAQDAARVGEQIMRAFPANMAAIHIQGDVELLREHAVGKTRPLLRTLFGAVTVVLLIACVNVAGLLLARAIRRRREYAVRLALGARAGAIVRASVFEGLLLSVAGGLLGLALAATAIRTALHLLPESMPRVGSVSIDGSVVAFTMLVALATGILCGLAPAFAALRTNLTESLKDGSHTGSGAASHAWLRSALVVLEIAVALVLVTVAGAFLRSYAKMRSVDLGFRPDHVLVAGYQLPLKHYTTQASADAFNQAVLDGLSAKPGVVAAGISNILPGSGYSAAAAYTVEGVPASAWHLQFAQFAIVYGADYFRTLDIRILEGRSFNQDDRADTMPVVMMNQSMAKHLWPGQSAIGKRIHVGNPKKPFPWATVVGVVADTALGARDDEPGADQWFIPAQQPAILFGPSGVLTNASDGFIALRSTLPPEQMMETLRSTVAGVDPQLALDPVEPMNDVISNVEAPRRFNTNLISAFALGALLLAVTGIYAVVAFSVSLRTQEIAIRMALGAQRGNITRLVLIAGVRLAALGCVLGVAGSLAVSRLVGACLFGVSATDPWIYGVGVAIMMALALLASMLPATRAASADPVKLLPSV